VVTAPTDFNAEWAEGWEWAREYRGLGLQVVPAHTPHAGQWKRPAVEAWVEFQKNLVPESLFARWYDPKTGEHRNRRNMGLITGAVSGGLVVVDLDTQKELGAEAWWIGLIAVHENGLEPETWAQRTGGGGRQVFFRAPEGWTPPTFKASTLGIDCRGEGGFVMAPPSMHSSGQIYDWELGREPWACELVAAPPWLIAALEKLRLEHGGGPTGPHERTESDAPKGPFGHDIDDREHKLAAVVWAAVVDLYRESPIPPPTVAQDAEVERIWTQYEATTRSRLERVPGVTNAELLEREGRGITLLRQKWSYAMARWETKVAEAAKVPKPESQNSTASESADSTRDDAGLGPDVPPTASRSASSFSGQPTPRRWLVEGWIAKGEVNSMYGGGATGKSLLALQLCYSSAIGLPWLGLDTGQASSLFVSCEDDDDELHRRHVAIKNGLGHGIGNPFGAVSLWDRVGHNNLLATGDGKGGLVAGPFLNPLKDELAKVTPGLLVLDTLADVYGGNEIDRVQVNSFLKTCLGGLIQERKQASHELTILLLGHPSKSSMADGTGFSGSTAWENGVRSRLYLSRPEDGGPDERTLERGKANYAGGDDGQRALIWSDGVFAALGGEVGLSQMANTVRNEVASAWAMGRPYVEKRGHPRNLHAALVHKLTILPQQPRSLVIAGVRAAIDEGAIYPSKNTAKRGWRTQEGG
jgi:hypothetical protein